MTEQEKRTHARKLNMARRQLTSMQKRQIVQEQLIDTPSMSDRQIAEAIGVSNSTVSYQRKKMEESGQVCESHTSTGADGKTYPRQVERKPAPKSEPIKNTTPQDPERIAEIPQCDRQTTDGRTYPRERKPAPEPSAVEPKEQREQERNTLSN